MKPPKQPARGAHRALLCERQKALALSAAAATCLLASTSLLAQKVFTPAPGLQVRIGRDTAYPNVVSMVYEGQFSYVRIERSEAGAAPNLHPFTIDPEVLRALLARMRLSSLDNRPLFTEDGLTEIVPPLVAALSRAKPDEDVSFAVPGKHLALGLLAPRTVTVARIFRTGDGLQVIVGLAQWPFEGEFIGSGYLIPFQPGRRAAPVDPKVRVALADAPAASKRSDWVELSPATIAAATPPAAAAAAVPVAVPVAPPAAPAAPGATAAAPAAAAPAPAAAVATPAAAAPAATVAAPAPAAAPLAAPARAPAAAVAAPAVPAAKPPADADALYRDVSERLKALQRLRDSGLISPQEYEEKRKQILRDL